MRHTAHPVDSRMELLPAEECLRLLANQHVDIGRVAFVRDGKPSVLPVNFRIDRGGVVFRTAAGSQLHRLVGQPVAFEVDRTDSRAHTGWSVVFQGVVQEIDDIADLLPLTRLALDPWAPAPRDRYLRIDATDITGRRIS